MGTYNITSEHFTVSTGSSSNSGESYSVANLNAASLISGGYVINPSIITYGSALTLPENNYPVYRTVYPNENIDLLEGKVSLLEKKIIELTEALQFLLRENAKYSKVCSSGTN